MKHKLLFQPGKPTYGLFLNLRSQLASSSLDVHYLQVWETLVSLGVIVSLRKKNQWVGAFKCFHATAYLLYTNKANFLAKFCLQCGWVDKNDPMVQYSKSLCIKSITFLNDFLLTRTHVFQFISHNSFYSSLTVDPKTENDKNCFEISGLLSE